MVALISSRFKCFINTVENYRGFKLLQLRVLLITSMSKLKALSVLACNYFYVEKHACCAVRNKRVSFRSRLNEASLY